jgi:hypothetical protein
MPPIKIANPLFIAILLSAAISIGGCSGSSVAGTTSTTINFTTTEADFGTIPQGHPKTVVFAFRNTGKGPLVIYRAEASCGCTQPEYPKEPITPGKKGEIKVTYDAKEIGHFVKTITVYHNDKNGMDVLEIRGMVVCE